MLDHPQSRCFSALIRLSALSHHTFDVSCSHFLDKTHWELAWWKVSDDCWLGNTFRTGRSISFRGSSLGWNDYGFYKIKMWLFHFFPHFHFCPVLGLISVRQKNGDFHMGPILWAYMGRTWPFCYFWPQYNRVYKVVLHSIFINMLNAHAHVLTLLTLLVVIFVQKLVLVASDATGTLS